MKASYWISGGIVLILGIVFSLNAGFWVSKSWQTADLENDCQISTGVESPSALNQLFERILPAVVAIRVIQASQTLPTPKHGYTEVNRSTTPYETVGSGFFWDKEGTIVTNYHVVAHAKEIFIELASGSLYRARLLHVDEKSDLALIRPDRLSEDFPVLAHYVGSSLQVGQTVLAIGNPFGLEASFSKGIISSLERYGLSGAGMEWVYQPYIQTDAAINKGNSGGPLIDLQGRVIGINTAIVSPYEGSVGVGFALPIARVKEVIHQLVHQQKVAHPHLGIFLSELPSLDEGVLIESVYPQSPASRKRITPGDRILSINGQKIASPKNFYQLSSQAKVGETWELTIQREQDVYRIHINLEEAESFS